MRNKIAAVTTAATTWLRVRDEQKRPTALKSPDEEDPKISTDDGPLSVWP